MRKAISILSIPPHILFVQDVTTLPIGLYLTIVAQRCLFTRLLLIEYCRCDVVDKLGNLGRSYVLICLSFCFQAYDNVESSVRKAAVFCMVSLHQRVGDELQPHLECLNGSKLKLLNLYIKRAQSQKEQSMPSSPRLQTPM